eukprot:230545-Chlamydomonas_euryale.AAC.1
MPALIPMRMVCADLLPLVNVTQTSHAACGSTLAACLHRVPACTGGPACTGCLLAPGACLHLVPACTGGLLALGACLHRRAAEMPLAKLLKLSSYRAELRDTPPNITATVVAALSARQHGWILCAHRPPTSHPIPGVAGQACTCHTATLPHCMV